MSNPYIVTYTGNGSNRDFQVPATYIRQAHVSVSVAGILTSAYVWHTSSIIRLDVAPGNGVEVVIIDQAPSEVLNIYSGNTNLSALSLNENFKQSVQLADFAFNAAKDIVDGNIPPGTITGPMLADGAVTAVKTSAGVQASLAKADSALQASAFNNAALTGNPTAPTPTALDNDTSIATTAFVQAAVVQSGPLAGFRNAVINGGFELWERATVYQGTGYGYRTADRWETSQANGSGAAWNIERRRDAGTASVSGDTFYARFEITTAGSGYTRQSFGQRIEDVKTFAGQTVTLSFRVRGSFSEIDSIQLIQDFSPGASAQTFLSVASGVTINSINNWQTVTFTATLPNVADKDIGSDSFLWLRFNLPVNVTGRIDITRVQLEPGPAATPFEHRPIGVELALCQRYFEAGRRARFTADVTTGVIYDISNFFKVTKRVEPTIVLSSVNAFRFPTTSGDVADGSAYGFSERRECNETGTGGRFASFYTADSEL